MKSQSYSTVSSLPGAYDTPLSHVCNDLRCTSLLKIFFHTQHVYVSVYPHIEAIKNKPCQISSE